MYDLEHYTLTEMLEKSSAVYAAHPALANIGDEAISYAELEPRTRKIAIRLKRLGACAGDRIAIVSESSPDWGLACFGILRAGCVVVPILTEFSREQMRNIIEHSGTRFLFVSKRLASKLETPDGIFAGATVLALDEIVRTEETGSPESEANAFVSAAVKADDVALIIYTSGTTGLSKGVMLTHRNILSNVESSRCFIVMTPKDRFLSILPLAHAYEFTLGLITPLLHGSSVSYIDKPPSESVLLPALAAVRPTIILTVPLVIEKIYRSKVKPVLEGISLYKYAMFRGVLSRIAGRKLMRTFGGKVRFFGIGGAPLDPETETFLHNAGFPYSIGYGLTETAPLITGNIPGKVKLHTTGIPANGIDLRIANPRVDTGEGEIQIRGANVSPGYYRDPERTVELFTEDGWFRTGDLGVGESDGRITVRGRLKTMILGATGENIYPEEIEAVLNSSPYVLESLVYNDEKGLTALVQLHPEILTQTEAKTSTKTAHEAWDEFKEGAVARFEKAVAHAEEQLEEAEEAASRLVERIRKEANNRLAAFSRLSLVKIQEEPFEKTPTQKIKRFMYPRKD